MFKMFEPLCPCQRTATNSGVYYLIEPADGVEVYIDKQDKVLCMRFSHADVDTEIDVTHCPHRRAL